MSAQYGCPPKVIFINRENCQTKTIESILRVHIEKIDLFLEDSIETGLLIIR
jgi:predicted nuclease of predicted toxin-antitoxin system